MQSIMVKSMDTRVMQTKAGIPPPPVSTCMTIVKSLPSLGFIFLICKMGLIVVPSSLGHLKD